MDMLIFEALQEKIDEDSRVRDALRDIIQNLEKQDRATQAILSKAHSTPFDQLQTVTTQAEESIKLQIATVQALSQQASKYPYYRYNGMWSRHIQDTIFSILFCTYLGGFSSTFPPQSTSQPTLLVIDQVGHLVGVPVNLKDRDAFHITIEEYLHALISLIDELARLSRNAVTAGDTARPVQIATFIKDLHAGFQLLNLKNDALRKRSDGIKYRVKEVEDVVYDLSLRGMIPRAGTT